MIIDYDHNPNITNEQRLQSLKESVQMALDEMTMGRTDGSVQSGDYNSTIRPLVDIFYPVGSYYETSNASFDPNVTWGGTWVLDSAGKVTVAYDSSDADFDAVGETGGAKTHTHTTGDCTLNVDQIPSHSHNILAHNNSGSSTGYGMAVTSNSVTLAWTASRIQNTGGGQAHNHGNTGSAGHLPPYVVVNRWHRTA